MIDNNNPAILCLMRYYKPKKEIQIMTTTAVRNSWEFMRLVHVLYDYDIPHPHPDCLYWIEDAKIPARSETMNGQRFLL